MCRNAEVMPQRKIPVIGIVFSECTRRDECFIHARNIAMNLLRSQPNSHLVDSDLVPSIEPAASVAHFSDLQTTIAILYVKILH
jgi:hypothetical protein